VLAAPDVVVAADAAPPRVAQLGDACSVGAGIGGLLPDDALALWAPPLLVRLLEVRGVAADAERALAEAALAVREYDAVPAQAVPATLGVADARQLVLLGEPASVGRRKRRCL
jgi:hypothetical protein